MFIIPTKQSIALLLISFSLSFFPIYMGKQGIGIWLSFVGIFLVSFILSPFFMVKFKDLDITLETPSHFYTEEKDSLSLTLISPFAFSTKIQILLQVEGAVTWEEIEVPKSLEPGENRFTFSFTPLRRGKILFKGFKARVEAPLQLWEIERFFSIEKEITALPNLRGVGDFALRFQNKNAVSGGLKVQKYKGQGTEFESLREYAPGFDIRSIDWKVSARKGKMVCREYQAETNHDIILALDCGSLMSAEFQGLTKLDYAINSLLILSYMAIKSGDRVGFLSFSEQVHSFLKPQSKAYMVQEIGNKCGDLSYQFTPSNFVVAIEFLMTQQKRRSLIILFTDFVDSVSAEMMKEYLWILSKRHLVVFVSIRDPFLDTYLEEQPSSLMDMHKQIACYSLRRERGHLFQELKRMGITTLDLFPSQISVPVLNCYLDIRQKERI